jgi:hypothetical protein
MSSWTHDLPIQGELFWGNDSILLRRRVGKRAVVAASPNGGVSYET